MIGILAGMGPKSTGPFVDKVVDITMSYSCVTHLNLLSFLFGFLSYFIISLIELSYLEYWQEWGQNLLGHL
jgi:aspartate/glutamate racemase